MYILYIKFIEDQPKLRRKNREGKILTIAYKKNKNNCNGESINR